MRAFYDPRHALPPAIVAALLVVVPAAIVAAAIVLPFALVKWVTCWVLGLKYFVRSI